MLINLFNQELCSPFHFSFARITVPLGSKELIGQIDGCQNSEFGRGTRLGLLGKGPHLRINIFGQLMKIGLISLALKREPMAKDFNLNGLRHHGVSSLIG